MRYLEPREPFLKIAAPGEKIELLISRHKQPVFIIAIHAREQAERNGPELRAVPADPKEYGLGALELDARNIMAYRFAGIDEEALLVQACDLCQARVYAVGSDAECAGKHVAFRGFYLNTACDVSAVRDISFKKVLHAREPAFFIQAVKQDALIEDNSGPAASEVLSS